jgi:ribosome-binding protein aMBF1 (putative translation factor)
MNPGLRIRLARIARGLTQEELGQCIHRTKTTVHHWDVKENWLILGQGEMLEAFLEVPKPAANAAQAA